MNQRKTKKHTEPQDLHGSYSSDEVTFLLRIMAMEITPTEEKERLIQSGQRHYSEMIGAEPSPTATHLELFHEALDEGMNRLADEVQQLALALKAARPQRPIVLVSFVRAGVPLGVLLKLALTDLGVKTDHYGISIIRDKGIDHAALATIEEQHDFNDIVFIDGWTGKGAIYGELKRSLAHRYPKGQSIPFAVLADPAGLSWLSASGDDWLIPFGILGATVSGLISRSILTNDGGWHGCLYYDHLQVYDISRQFIALVNDCRHARHPDNSTIDAAVWTDEQRISLQQQSTSVIQYLAALHNIDNLNRIKPGIAEATRAILRRVPEKVLVSDLDDPHIRLLRHLAKQKHIELAVMGERLAPYRAITIIKKTS